MARPGPMPERAPHLATARTTASRARRPFPPCGDRAGAQNNRKGETMTDDDKQDPTDLFRRKFLAGITSAVVGGGALMACYPFISSMNPSADVLAKATVEADLSDIAVGKVKTVLWQERPIFIFHRTPEEIKAMEASNGSSIDPEPDSKRVLKPEWLVLIGICTHLGCVPNKTDAGWLCPCHGSMYDNSGRVVRGPAPKNLYLPPYHFISDTKILLGPGHQSETV
jgi:ubiquinol-cytochrome c reductase iron-sulfur subunit